MGSVATVHIVDDNADLRESVRRFLESEELNPEPHESAEHFLERADLSSPGCVILDLRMPGMGGIELLRQLKQKNVQLPAIVLSAFADVHLTVAAMQLGAIDVIQKPFSFPSLLSVVKEALNRCAITYHDNTEAETVRQRFESLSPRERELLQLIVAGESNKQIAMTLNIAISTVTHHRARVMTKLAAKNAADLTRLSLLSGMLPNR